MREIKKIGTHQSAKVLATMLMLMSVVFVVPATIYMVFFTEAKPKLQSLILLLTPLFYALFGYIFYGILFFFYNLAVKLVGGVEVEVE